MVSDGEGKAFPRWVDHLYQDHGEGPGRVRHQREGHLPWDPVDDVLAGDGSDPREGESPVRRPDPPPAIQQPRAGRHFAEAGAVPEEIGWVTVFPASDEARSITGQAFELDGGVVM